VAFTPGAVLVDRVLEASIVGSYSRVGPAVRRRAAAWDVLAADRLAGKTVAITGATSGIGKAAAFGCARQGAEPPDRVVVERSSHRAGGVDVEVEPGEHLGVRDDLRGWMPVDEPAAGRAVDVVRADLADLASVRTAADALNQLPRLDVLVHNAGTLTAQRRESVQGIELTVATHLIAPFLMSFLCAPHLRRSGGRILVVTSGGMYAQPLDVDQLRHGSDPFSGVTAYARAKRAQVSLVRRCAGHLSRCGVGLAAMHPGWADTPGLKESLPGFYRVMRPLLRSADEGADTTAWLSGAPLAKFSDGLLWLDRSPRALHRSSKTARSDTVAERKRLVEFCVEMSGLTVPELRAWDVA